MVHVQEVEYMVEGRRLEELPGGKCVCVLRGVGYMVEGRRLEELSGGKRLFLCVCVFCHVPSHTCKSTPSSHTHTQ